MRLLERLYRSRFGSIVSGLGHIVAMAQRPFMVYGYRDPASGVFRKWTRMSSDVVIMSKSRLSIGEHVWIWHHSILDATEGLIIEEGVQIGAWVGIFTHGSENAIRLLGKKFVDIPNAERKGYTRGPVKIGAFTFVGAGSVILPGLTIGKGSLIGAGTVVMTDIPPYSIVVGSPGKVKGTTIDIDRRFFEEWDYSETYYDAQALAEIQNRAKLQARAG